MARQFNGSNLGLTITSALGIAAYPFTMVCWFRADGPQTATLVTLNTAAGVLRHALRVLNTGVVRNEYATGSASADTTTTYTTNLWMHAAAVTASATDRRVFLNGGGKGINSANSAFAAVGELWIGEGRVGVSPFQGQLCEVALWNVALTDGEIATLAAGVSPRALRPDKLIIYWPIYGLFAPEIPYKGVGELTLSNVPAKSDHHVAIYGPA